MVKYVIFFILLLISYRVTAAGKIIYTDPLPGAQYVSIQNNIIIGFDKAISLKETKGFINITGSASLHHSGRTIITKDRKKIIFIPENNFLPGEKITVSYTGTGKEHNFCFYTMKHYVLNNDAEKTKEYTYAMLPPVMPELTVTVNNNPANGYIFLSNFSFNSNYTPYLLITDRNGLPYHFKAMDNQIQDFKKQNKGTLTYFDNKFGKYYEMDPNFNLIDSFYCGNGYRTDGHDLQIIEGNHALLLGLDIQIVDMSQLVPGGHTAARVVGLIIQELDENKNVVFQWRSWDHFLITDALHEDLLAYGIDYVHGNTIELDHDGNLLISSRNLDEVTKVSRTTGDIVWRLGGNKNQFTFVNDTIRFTYQHDSRRLPNGNITIYDNGNYHTPPFSRAIEYSLDEVNKTAILVWEYRNTPDMYGEAMGNVQRLPGGNTLIGWGITHPTVTEVTPEETIAFEMTLPAEMYSYRVFKLDWSGESSLPKEYRLLQNFPNPFNPSTTIRFEIPAPSYVNITIYDILGRTIKILVTGHYNPGSYEKTFDGKDLPTGIYFCVMKSENFNSVTKMILAK